MKLYSLLPFVFFIPCISHSQSLPKGYVEDEKFNKEIARTIDFSIPIVGVSQLDSMNGQYLLLDTRSEEENRVSHIPGAKYLGYRSLDEQLLAVLPKDTSIVLYCSIGYRSEKTGEELRDMGFTNVYNLYGSIFEWVNRGKPIVSDKNEPTDSLHTYNRKWSQWVDNPEITKVW